MLNNQIALATGALALMMYTLGVAGDRTDGKCENSSWSRHGRYCYYVSDQLASFIEAKQKCGEYSANLTSINNDTENDYIISILDSSIEEAWVGLHIECESSACVHTLTGWQWADGTPYNEKMFHKWVGEEPQSTECCGRLKNTGWLGYLCSGTYRFVCSKQGDVCADTWTHHGNKCYHVPSNTATFNQAMDGCEDLSSQLTSISSEEEHSFLASILSDGEEAWIGLQHPCTRCCENFRTRQGWRWVDGSLYEQNGYVNWYPGEPISAETCGKFKKKNGSYEWASESCSKELRFVCRAAYTDTSTTTDGVLLMTSTAENVQSTLTYGMDTEVTSSRTPSTQPACLPDTETTGKNDFTTGPLEWDVWMGWSGCSRSCGSGWMELIMFCSASCPFVLEGQCFNISYNTTVKECNTALCPVDGYWNSWSEWTACSSTCDKGTRRRTRQCLGPSDGGLPCDGRDKKTELCSVSDCPKESTPTLVEVVFKESDRRLSAMAVGGVWILLPLLMAVTVVLFDLHTFIRHVKQLW